MKIDLIKLDIYLPKGPQETEFIYFLTKICKIMSAKFHAVPRMNPRDLSQAQKYYATLVDRQGIEKDELYDFVSLMSTVSEADTYAVIKALKMLIIKNLEQGRTVKIGDLGYFYVTISGEGKDTPEEVDASSIKKIRVRFRPGPFLAKAARDIKFERIDNVAGPPGDSQNDGNAPGGNGGDDETDDDGNS
jgi:predicted histone-like DNA-binding protein